MGTRLGENPKRSGGVVTIDLVTGGAGFIGSHLVRRLVADGARVRVVDDLSTGDAARLGDLAEGIEFIRADLASAGLASIVSGVRRVFHLAAVPSVPRSVRDPVTAHVSVATATLRLLLAARDAGVERFLNSSSSSVYGETDTSPKHEGLPPRPVSPYAVAKAAAEGYARVAADIYGVPTISLRYFNVFGPWQDPRSTYAAVIPLFITRALAGETLVVHGDGKQTRDFTFVTDVVEANLAAAASEVADGRVYNVAAGSPHTVNELVSSIAGVLGRDLDVRHDEPRAGDVRHSHADVAAARRDLGWSPRVDFDEGIRRTVEWYRGGR